MTQRVPDESGLGRRPFLKALGGAGVASGLAGCTGANLGVSDKDGKIIREASPVGFGSYGQLYSSAKHRTVIIGGTREKEGEMPSPTDYSITTHIVQYSDRSKDDGAVVISTPKVTKFNVDFNPLAHLSVKNLLRLDRVTRPLVDALDVNTGDTWDWIHGPEHIPGYDSSGKTGNDWALNGDYVMKPYAGVMPNRDGPPIAILLNSLRLERTDRPDVVFAAYSFSMNEIDEATLDGFKSGELTHKGYWANRVNFQNTTSVRRFKDLKDINPETDLSNRQ